MPRAQRGGVRRHTSRARDEFVRLFATLLVSQRAALGQAIFRIALTRAPSPTPPSARTLGFPSSSMLAIPADPNNATHWLARHMVCNSIWQHVPSDDLQPSERPNCCPREAFGSKNQCSPMWKARQLRHLRRGLVDVITFHPFFPEGQHDSRHGRFEEILKPSTDPIDLSQDCPSGHRARSCEAAPLPC